MRTILIVDDDNAIRETLGELLHDEGFTIFLARDGAQALEFLDTMPMPALVLVDWFMPHVDGAAFCQRLQSKPRWASIPIVVISASSHEIPANLVPRARILSKPFDLHELTRIVREAVGVHALG